MRAWVLRLELQRGSWPLHGGVRRRLALQTNCHVSAVLMVPEIQGDLDRASVGFDPGRYASPGRPTGPLAHQSRRLGGSRGRQEGIAPTAGQGARARTRISIMSTTSWRLYS